MPYYRRIGDVPRKRHTQFRRPDGGLFHEELMGIEGFSSDSALLYHHRSPCDIVDVGVWGAPEATEPNHPLMPRLLHTHQLPVGGDAVTGRHLLAANDDLRLSYVAADETSPLYRNAIGDELYFVESGTARCETIFGDLDVASGDFVVVPTNATHRWVPTGEEVLRLLVAEANGHIRAPQRYVSERGQFLEQSPYCERDLRAPTEPHVESGRNVDVLVRTRSGGTRYTNSHHPFDVVGWDGCLYPYAFNMSDFEPLTGRVHTAPPAFQAFEGPNFVVCSFVPHRAEYHPDAVIVQYDHANVDSDELMFFHHPQLRRAGDVKIPSGSMNWHPAGFIHGPLAGELESATDAFNKGLVDIKPIQAVMIDTFRPMAVGAAAKVCEDPTYLSSWRGA